MTFNFNSELYADPNLAEGVDYARRHRRHERFDDTQARTDDMPKTTILAPLELSTPLRDAMFTKHSRSRRKHTTTQPFWTFVAVCRDALDRLQAEQIVSGVGLRCLEG